MPRYCHCWSRPCLPLCRRRAQARPCCHPARQHRGSVAILSPEKNDVAEQLEEIQKRDWKSLSTDEKKAAYYVAFGPHGGRKPIHERATASRLRLALRVPLAVAGLLSCSSGLPVNHSKEWQEAMNERAIEQKMNPITGVSSAFLPSFPAQSMSRYRLGRIQGKGFVQ
ncbi:cytochrome c oxidase subunit IV-domain-containing protein [Roridomyces roridus]|uniref:Cytochrome c oxidase subunit IV-domain-containing protein n=1 Tax=Roridomyces roridus TaxID=1738132 RepID=A0AAD7AX37_9AGAR|nr:cytochrome c oxidase subunit IV-domain-containing protein [Roridomyces roridus]